MRTPSNGNIFHFTGPLCGEYRLPVNFPHKGQWRGALMFSLIYAWIKDWVNNREVGDLRRHCKGLIRELWIRSCCYYCIQLLARYYLQNLLLSGIDQLNVALTLGTMAMEIHGNLRCEDAIGSILILWPELTCARHSLSGTYSTSINIIYRTIEQLECVTWYHHPRRLQCVLSTNLRIFKVATWHCRCRHNLKNNCFWDNLQ